MKRYILLLSASFSMMLASGQNSVPNGDFESWRAGILNYPAGFPVNSGSESFAVINQFNIDKTTNSHHGSYALMLKTLSNAMDTAFGYFVNINPGSSSPASWHGGMPYTLLPTGISGWYKYNVGDGSDSASIIVAFSRAGNNIRTYYLRLGGNKTVWTPFSFQLSPALVSCGLANDDDRNIAIDAQGNVWVATNGGGVSVYDGAHWNTYSTSNTSGGLASNTVHSIMIDGSGNKWFGTDAGASRFTGSSWTKFTTADGLAGNNVYGIAADASGNIWFATMGSGISVFDGTNWTTYNTANTSNGLVSNNVRNIKKDGSNNMWIGTDGGVSRYNGVSWNTYTTSDGLVNNDVRHIQTGQGGDMWFATYGGVSRLHSGAFISFTTSNSGLASNSVNKIAVDPNNVKWFATEGGGVSTLDATNTTWVTLTTGNGLVNNTVKHISIDPSQNKWFGTTGGVSKFDGNKWTSFTFAGTTTPDSVVYGALSCKFGPGMDQPKGVPGSVVYLDSIGFTGVAGQPAAMNGDFELWGTKPMSFPNGWNILSTGGQETGVSQTTDAHQGNYAVELTTYLGDSNGSPAAQPAIISTGYFPKNCGGSCVEKGGLPYSAMNDTLVLWYKYVPSGTDNGIVNYTFKKDGAPIAGNSYLLPAASVYKRVGIPVSAGQTPDTVILNIGSTNWSSSTLANVGSVLKVDSVYFRSQLIQTGLKSLKSEDDGSINVIPNPSNGKFRITSSLENISSVEIFNVAGQKIFSKYNIRMRDVSNLDTPVLERGIYFLKILEGKTIHTKKIIVN
ncbi:MAG TPA: two-component regulator propeller domain-containing protein [Bacteroidales bacterium]|nr:two-component regulator propeller domain-containing protein [Bacteroidales bacterium]